MLHLYKEGRELLTLPWPIRFPERYSFWPSFITRSAALDFSHFFSVRYRKQIRKIESGAPPRAPRALIWRNMCSCFFVEAARSQSVSKMSFRFFFVVKNEAAEPLGRRPNGRLKELRRGWCVETRIAIPQWTRGSARELVFFALSVVSVTRVG